MNKFVKKIILIFALLIFSTNAFSNIVSDSEGNTFVSKGEFDRVKNEFNEGIKKYEKSLEDKIAGNIADYLSGMNISKTTDTYGYIKQMYDANHKSTEFRYGGSYGHVTENPMSNSVYMINPYISVIGIYYQRYTSFQIIEYFSHNAGVHSGKWEKPDAGCYLAGFEKRSFNGVDYYGLVDNYYTKKWQFKLIYSGMYEHSTQTGVQTGDSYFRSNVWDFKFTIPTSKSVSFSYGNKTIPCVQTCINSSIDELINNTSCAANYYTKSVNDTVYGWEKENFYVYETDSSATKTETPVSESYRRHKGSTDVVKTEAFSYTINMPKTIDVPFDSLINLEASDAIDEPVYSYNGIPLVYIDDAYDKLEIPLSITNSGTVNTSKYKLYISKVPFDNRKITETAISDSDILYKDTNFVPTGNRSIQLDISGLKNVTLWLKLIPETEDENVALSVSLVAWGPMLLSKA